jgi:hypothetical protein
MNLNVRSLPWLALLSYSTYSTATVLPYLSLRSVSVNAYRELVGWQTLINRAHMASCYGVFSITPAYERSYNDDHIAQSLFCGALCEHTCGAPNLAFKVQGSQVSGRDARALLADYFYLPPDFSSVINIDPKIDTFLTDFDIYVGFDAWAPGLFFRAHAPMTETRWDLGFCESSIIQGTRGYDPGYYSDSYTTHTTEHIIVGMERSDLLSNFEQFVFEKRCITNSPTISYQPLRYARMSSYRLTQARLAEIQCALGYNMLLGSDHHLGLELRCSIPTGNRPTGEFLFEPIVGNGHHGELGLGLTGHWNFWHDKDNCQYLGLYCDAYVTHMLKTCQHRTFDLVGKPLSRYMIAVQTGTPVEDLTTDQHTPVAQFQRTVAPVANITTLPVDVSCAVQTDIACKLTWATASVQWDLGYDFWYRSREKISLNHDCPCTNLLEKNWALKGDAFICGFPQLDVGTISSRGVALSPSQSKATIFSGTNNWPNGIDGHAWNQNPGIDTPAYPAYDGSNNPLVTHQRTYSDTWDQVYTTIDPVLITYDNLDMNNARSRGMSHTIFTHISYTLQNCGTWTPYLGIGGYIEFGRTTKQHGCVRPAQPCSITNQEYPTPCTTNCHGYCSLSRWGLWIKGGLSFNGKKN